MKRSRVITTALVLALGAGVIAFAPLPGARATPANRHFRVEASSFKYTPATIRVNAGDHVAIDLVSTDVVHGLHIDGYDVSVSADPGRTASLSFVANRTGTFRLRCSVTCGAMHPFMIGKLHVGRNDLLWRALVLTLFAGLAGISLARMREVRQ
jgi:heme/copper-type cytochrome/quinol oxidase subunit 2